MLDTDEAVAICLHGCAFQIDTHVFTHLDAVAAADGEAKVVKTGRALVGNPLPVLVEQGDVVGLVGEHVAFFPLEGAEEFRHIAVVVVEDIERNPVPSWPQVNALDVTIECGEHQRFLGGADECLGQEFNSLGWCERHNLACLVVPEAEFEVTSQGQAIIDSEVGKAFGG